jgi:hypothetical protein
LSQAPLYFAYGSNLDAEQMKARCPTARALRIARLADHRLDFTHYSKRWSGGAADVLPAPGRSVWGLVYEMGPDDFARLDPFESGYRRIALALDAGGEPLAATSYTVVEKGGKRPTRSTSRKCFAGARAGACRQTTWRSSARSARADRPSSGRPERGRERRRSAQRAQASEVNRTISTRLPTHPT